MKKMMKYLLLGFLVMFLFTYTGGLFDDAFKQLYHTGVWYKDVVGSIKYYFLWVIPYWWLPIIIGTVIVGFVLYGIGAGIEKLRSQSLT